MNIGPDDISINVRPVVVDYEQLNREARLLYDAGRQRGEQDGASRVADERLRAGLDPRVQEQIDGIRPLGVWLDACAAEELLDVMIGLKRRLGFRTSIRERRAIMQFNERVKETRR